MSLTPSLRHALAGAALAGVAAALAVWAAVARPILVPAAILLGGGLGWLLDRRFYRPVRGLANRLGGGEGEPIRASGSETVNQLAVAVEQATTDLRRRIEEAEAGHRHLREILESMSDGVLVADRQDRVELLNSAFAALFAARHPRPGQPVLELSRSSALVGFLDRLRTAAGVATERIESEAGRTLELRGRPLADRPPGGGGARPDRAAAAGQDPARPGGQRVARAADPAHRHPRLRREPARWRGGGAGDRRRGFSTGSWPSAAGSRRYSRTCWRCRVWRATSRRRFVPGIDLAALVERSLETVRGLAAERQVELRFSRLAVPPIAGNEESLERLLLNLLENAIKYNREGGQVERRPDGERRRAGARGRGHAASACRTRDLPRIFERFYRVDAAAAAPRAAPGWGWPSSSTRRSCTAAASRSRASSGAARCFASSCRSRGAESAAKRPPGRTQP